MKQVSTMGLVLAKHVFQAHGADAEGTRVQPAQRSSAFF